MIGADGSEPTRLFHGGCCIGDWDGPVWSPDGRQIAFFDDVDVDYGTWLVVNADGIGRASKDAIEGEEWGLAESRPRKRTGALGGAFAHRWLAFWTIALFASACTSNGNSAIPPPLRSHVRADHLRSLPSPN